MRKGQKQSAETRQKLVAAWENNPARRQKYREMLRRRGLETPAWDAYSSSTTSVDPDFDEYES